MSDGKLPPPNRIEFGKLKAHRGDPNDWPPPPVSLIRRRKRSLIVGLVALGAGAFALSQAMSRKTCEQKLLENPNDPCKTTSSTRSGGGSHGYYFGSGSRSSGSTSSTTSGHGAVSRGGFGSAGSHFSGHGG